MNKSEKQLWERINNFTIDDENAAFTFSARLARENGWSRKYTFEVIEEYKKFIFLCCVSPTPVTPSDPIDQAWHLHLTYTRSYWMDFCRNTLGREIHHNPTKGGASDKEKFSNCYDTSHKLYLEKFVSEPPAAIWNDAQTRFTDINFRRINLNRYWLIKKPDFNTRILIIKSTVLFLACIFIQAVGEGAIAGMLIIGFFIALFYSLKNDKRKSGNRLDEEKNASTCSGDSGSADIGCSSHSGAADSGDSGCSGCGGCGGD